MKTGGGTNMRAYAVLEILSSRYRVALVVAALNLDVDETDVPPETRELADRCVVYPARRRASWVFRTYTCMEGMQLRVLLRMLYPSPIPMAAWGPSLDDAIVDEFGDIGFDALHAFRLSMAPLALSLRRRLKECRPAMFLDIDDYESKATMRSARLQRHRQGRQWYLAERLEAVKYRRLERRLLPRFDCVFTCSEPDRREILADYECSRVAVLPNTAPMPDPLTREESADETGDGAFTFLFVGTLDYPPNADAIEFFCTEILPCIRERTDRPFRVAVVGRSPPPEVKALARHAEVDVVGEVPTVGPSYAAADAVIVPIRTGGGTRIKILEAFSYGTPVISTTVGAEGIEAVDGKEIVIADDAKAFAAACARLMSEPALREEIAKHAFDRVRRSYTPDAISGGLLSTYREVIGDLM